MPPLDLSLVPTADLMDALFTRYDNAVFHGVLARPIEREDKTMVYSIRTTGDAYYAIGLAQKISHFLLTEQEATMSDLDPSDL